MKKYISILAFAFIFPVLAFAETATVSWPQITGNDGYFIQFKTSDCATGSTWTTAATVAVDVTSWTSANFAANQPLCYRVAALKPGAVIQTWSTPVDHVIPGPLPAPNPVTVVSP